MAKTLAEIAQMAGVSQATVSRVMNNQPGASEDTRRTVFSAMESLGISKPHVRNSRSLLVAMITPDLINPIFPLFANSLSIKLAQQRLIPLMCTYTSGGAAEETYIDLLLKQDIAGAIFIGGQYNLMGTNHDHYRLLAKQNIPSIFLNATGDDIEGPRITTDDRTAARLALRHLIDLGHTEIGLVLGNRNSYPSMIKYRAAREFLSENDVDLEDDRVAWTDYSIESGQAAAGELLSRGVTSLMCASDLLALGAIRAARHLGLSVPDDVSIVGYDDSRMMAFVDPPLTTVRQPVDSMCESAVVRLQLMMSEPGRDHSTTLVFEPELVVRKSTARSRQP